MAKIVLTFEDTPNGGVKVTAEPSFETMMTMNQSGHSLTSAHGYALCAINAVRREGKKKEPTSLLIPRIGRL